MEDTKTGKVTNTVIRSHGGMPEWALLGVGIAGGRPRLFWPYTADIDGQRFLTRFIFFRTPWAALDVTRIGMADDQREFPHDHSRTFWSLKFGWYEEDVYTDPADLSVKTHKAHPRFSVHRLRYTEAHSITRVSPRLVTVLFLSRKQGKSHYWTPSGFQTTGMRADQEDGSIWG